MKGNRDWTRQITVRLKRVAAAYQANREALEPIVRVLADAVALAALVRRRGPEPRASGAREGTAP